MVSLNSKIILLQLCRVVPKPRVHRLCSLHVSRKNGSMPCFSQVLGLPAFLCSQLLPGVSASIVTWPPTLCLHLLFCLSYKDMNYVVVYSGEPEWSSLITPHVVKDSFFKQCLKLWAFLDETDC